MDIVIIAGEDIKEGSAVYVVEGRAFNVLTASNPLEVMKGLPECVQFDFREKRFFVLMDAPDFVVSTALANVLASASDVRQEPYGGVGGAKVSWVM